MTARRVVDEFLEQNAYTLSFHYSTLHLKKQEFSGFLAAFDPFCRSRSSVCWFYRLEEAFVGFPGEDLASHAVDLSFVDDATLESGFDGGETVEVIGRDDEVVAGEDGLDGGILGEDFEVFKIGRVLRGGVRGVLRGDGSGVRDGAHGDIVGDDDAGETEDVSEELVDGGREGGGADGVEGSDDIMADEDGFGASGETGAERLKVDAQQVDEGAAIERSFLVGVEIVAIAGEMFEGIGNGGGFVIFGGEFGVEGVAGVDNGPGEFRGDFGVFAEAAAIHIVGGVGRDVDDRGKVEVEAEREKEAGLFEGIFADEREPAGDV